MSLFGADRSRQVITVGVGALLSVVMGAVLLLVGNLLADLALIAVDPRVDFATLASQ